MPNQIVLLTGNHLCHNPRVIKEAATLAGAGYDVEVLGGWIDSKLKARDQELVARMGIRFTPVVDITAGASTKRLTRRLRSKLGDFVHTSLGRENAWQMGLSTPFLRQRARCSEAALLIAHSEPGLVAADDLRKSGRRVGVDLEDWFSEDLLPNARRRRPVRLLRGIEQNLLRSVSHCSCPSRAMSDALAAEFGCRPPTVIYNAFEWCERRSLDGTQKDRRERSVPSIHWYSQTLGYGRGLEDLLDALSHLKHDLEVHLRGKAVSGFEDWLARRVPQRWRNRIFLHSPVANDELLSRISEHDIGFAGEMKYCRSRDLTVTNKILHYLLAGLAVVASDTTGQKEVATQAPGAVLIYPSGEPVALAKELNELLAAPERVRAARAAALRAAEQTFCWERVASILLRSVEGALAKA